jgi:hypothetical protein
LLLLDFFRNFLEIFVFELHITDLDALVKVNSADVITDFALDLLVYLVQQLLLVVSVELLVVVNNFVPLFLGRLDQSRVLLQSQIWDKLKV